MEYAVGSLVKARGREWVVLPESTTDLLHLRPLGGTDDEVTGIYLPIEPVEPAQFDLPDPTKIGDYRSCRLLRDAVRIGFRSSAGPFRSFAQLGFEPRPYQLVPLLMALKLEPIRLLVADDVGIGKTIEACLVARELIDRGESNRLAVLCPPHLAEQWQKELNSKFHIDAELVLTSTATRLERNLGMNESLFDRYPHVVVSMDFIKAERRRNDFIRTCPELVIIDEAHTCAYPHQRGGGKHLRHELVKNLSKDPDRHVILVTATPHSGKEDAFRSLLTFLDEDFVNLPDDLTGPNNVHHRRRLAQHFVQRRRADIRSYLNEETTFPERDESEETYTLSPEYKKFFERVLAYAREIVEDEGTSQHRQRVRWWSALALLRSLASSPVAAEATLRSRASTADTDTVEEADELGRRAVFDLDIDDATEVIDVAPGSDMEPDDDEETKNRRRLRDMAKEAERLYGDKDLKLQKGIKLIKKLVKDGFRPIVFCRFIPTAEYVAEQLRKALPKKVDVTAITGLLPPSDREQRVLQLTESEKRVLVCTDCLSEGINLQEHFDAVMHYDLSWNPTRHEQREGRVDRFGQKRPEVRVITYYGIDNQIDGIVLDVLIRKHKAIRSSLGISVSVPTDTKDVIEAIFEGLLLRERTSVTTDFLPGLEEYLRPSKEAYHATLDKAADREKRSRTMFAQETIKVDEVSQELFAMRDAIGSGTDVASFTKDALAVHGAIVSPAGDSRVRIDLTEAPRSLRDAVGDPEPFTASFVLGQEENVECLLRTHPFVEGLASHVMNTALDVQTDSKACRAGAIRTSMVDTRTTLLLMRFRYHIITKKGNEEKPLLAEDCQLLAFSGSPEDAQWLEDGVAESLLKAEPEANVSPDQATHFVQRVVDDFDGLRQHLDDVAHQRGEELLQTHRRVRDAAKMKGVTYRVEPKLPPDVLGIYVYLPVGG